MCVWSTAGSRASRSVRSVGTEAVSPGLECRILTSGAPPGTSEAALGRLQALLRETTRVLVLTGAGCSTDSGIPDYRNRDGEWKRQRPIELRQFLSSETIRRRYWARSMIGWARVRAAKPNVAHYALARLQRLGYLATLITQNVDGLHQRAGSPSVIDLHGRLDRVECLDCGGLISRECCQRELEDLNPHWRIPAVVAAPDGDADLDSADYSEFRIPSCTGCGGMLKPRVVFFGESVPRVRVAACHRRLQAADALLVIGSSLMVWSGYRFVRAAGARGIPIVLLNQGQTRADAEASFKVVGRCADVLSALVQRLESA